MTQPSLRPELPADEQLVDRIVYQVLFEQLQAVIWPREFRDQLLNQQVRAKRNSYANAYSNADRAIIVFDGQPIGAMIVDRSGEHFELVDISILPAHRGAGIGTRLIVALCTEAETMKKAVRLFVSVTNPRARELYARLGFRVIQELETDLVMERRPDV